MNLKQSKQPAEDEINLVVEEDTHKDKGFLLISSNMDYFHFPMLSFLIFTSSLIADFKDIFYGGVVSNA